MEEKKKEKAQGNIVIPELKKSGTVYHVMKRTIRQNTSEK